MPSVSVTAAQRSTGGTFQQSRHAGERIWGAPVSRWCCHSISVGELAWVMSETVEVEVRGPVAEGAGLGWFKKEAFCPTGGTFCRVIVINQTTTCTC